MFQAYLHTQENVKFWISASHITVAGTEALPEHPTPPPPPPKKTLIIVLRAFTDMPFSPLHFKTCLGENTEKNIFIWCQTFLVVTHYDHRGAVLERPEMGRS